MWETRAGGQILFAQLIVSFAAITTCSFACVSGLRIKKRQFIGWWKELCHSDWLIERNTTIYPYIKIPSIVDHQFSVLEILNWLEYLRIFVVLGSWVHAAVSVYEYLLRIIWRRRRFAAGRPHVYIPWARRDCVESVIIGYEQRWVHELLVTSWQHNFRSRSR